MNAPHARPRHVAARRGIRWYIGLAVEAAVLGAAFLAVVLLMALAGPVPQ